MSRLPAFSTAIALIVLVSGLIGAGPAHGKIAIYGNWVVGESTAAASNTPSTLAFLEADEGVETFVAGCSANGASAFLTNTTFWSGQHVELEWRLDDEPARRSDLVSTPNVIGWPMGEASIAVLRALMGAQRLRVHYQDRGGRMHDASFNLAGATEALSRISAACGWR